jgi:predicted metal-binding protein
MAGDIYPAASKLAEELGFTHYGPLDPATIHPRHEVRDTCATDKCHLYGTNWSCPPACGTVDECAAQVAQYSHGILLQTTAQLEDEFDIETMQSAREEHAKRMKEFAKQFRGLPPCGEGKGQPLVFSVGHCEVCEKCAYPEPCRIPGSAMSSMEAFGMVVSDVCQANDIPYYYGKGTLTYTACALW